MLNKSLSVAYQAILATFCLIVAAVTVRVSALRTLMGWTACAIALCAVGTVGVIKADNEKNRRTILALAVLGLSGVLIVSVNAAIEVQKHLPTIGVSNAVAHR